MNPENFCIYCERVLPPEQLVVVDVAYDEMNQPVPLYTCQVCSPVVWRHVQATRTVFEEAYILQSKEN